MAVRSAPKIKQLLKACGPQFYAISLCVRRLVVPSLVLLAPRSFVILGAVSGVGSEEQTIFTLSFWETAYRRVVDKCSNAAV